ncbi:MAG: hypothetical protein ACI4M6_02235 [Christensenellaceae bacterium]
MTDKCGSPFKFFKVTKNQTILDVAKIICVPPRIIINMNNLTENVSNGDVLIYDRAYRLTVVDFAFFADKSKAELERILKLNEIEYFYIGQIVAEDYSD